jgi:hypothetical protein
MAIKCVMLTVRYEGKGSEIWRQDESGRQVLKARPVSAPDPLTYCHITRRSTQHPAGS